MLTLFKGAEITTGDSREMYEDIFAAIFRGNKTETFFRIKPLYSTENFIRHN
ncbi:hypothetical protein SAMN02744778_02135 [Pantoea sp. GL120224-02]|nr:hypothetical protein SAMN02744778_02135 [Pantoea sp. GL120224-02]